MIEKPPQLNLDSLSDPKSILRKMLESTDRQDQGLLSSPLNEINPMSLDELVSRIDSGALALNQIPDPQDIEKLVQYYQLLREKFNFELQMGIKPKQKRKAQTKTYNKPIPSISDMLEKETEDGENEDKTNELLL